MNLALAEKRVKELTTQELARAYEERLVDEGLADIEAGRFEVVDEAFFNRLRSQVRTLAAQ